MTKRSIPQRLLQDFTNIIRPIVEQRAIDEEVSLNDLMDPELKALDPGLGTVWGQCLAAAVSRKLLPLQFIGFNNQRHNLYRVKRRNPDARG